MGGQSMALELTPIQRLTRDLAKSSQTLSRDEVKFLVGAYYTYQTYRISSNHQIRQLEENNEPHNVLNWLAEQHESIEKQIKRALDRWTDSIPLGVWCKCAPDGTLVRKGNSWVPIESLETGSEISSWHPKKYSRTGPKPIEFSSRDYDGDLIRFKSDATDTRTTPNHRHIVRLNHNKDYGHVVYLMRQGTRWRVGRCQLYHKGQRERLRLYIQQRAVNEKADAWILKLFGTSQEAAYYEKFCAAHYGLTEWMFTPLHGSETITQSNIDKLHSMLDAVEQNARAKRCLEDHGLLEEFPLFNYSPNRTKGKVSLKIAATNVIPELMSFLVPLKNWNHSDWVPIKSVTREHYKGKVHSLEIAPHHLYHQDGIVTCNSICGIGPVIAAGLISNIDIEKCPTVGHIWSYAGIDTGGRKWEKGMKRPWNAEFKSLVVFKLGESFVKVQNNNKDIYGKMFAQRKEKETRNNNRGAFKEQAEEILKAKRIGKDTEAYRHLINGRLPPAQIHARARRWTVKLFLAHYHAEAYRQHFKKEPPLPYPMAILGHSMEHMIEGPQS